MSRKVTVIGGGLAGLYAAHSAALHGADVVLHEKGVIGSKHNCGELFTETYSSVPEECKVNRINELDINLDNERFHLTFPSELSPFIMTDKCNHELLMMEKCVAAGVAIHEKSKVNSVLNDSFVIIATGTSEYNRSMGKAVNYIVNRNNFFTGDDDTIYINIRDDLLGYSWVFPKRDLLNIGEGIYDYKNSITFSKPDKKCIVYSGGGLLPMPTMSEYYNSNLYFVDSLRVGNAAGLVNPMAGGGEHLAAISGILAGCLVARKQESKYITALNDIIGDEMRIGITFYELAKKQDKVSLKMLLKNMFNKKIGSGDIELINKNIRKTIAKWIPMPDVDEEEMIKFIGE